MLQFFRIFPTGTVRKRLIHDQKIPSLGVVSVCEHDTASAYLSSALDREDAVIISSGTWALMGCELETPLITEESRRYNIANEGGYPGHHRFLKNVMGSWILQEIREDCRRKGVEYSYARLEAEAKKANPFVWFIDVDDELFFSPGNMSEKIQKNCLIRYGNAPESIGALVRCVYESLAMKYRRNLEILRQTTGKNFAVINIIGGGSQDALMCRCTAAACGIPVAAGPREATALGNIMIQLVAAGEIASVSDGRKIIAASDPPVWYEPEDAGHWEEGYRRYSELFGYTNLPGANLT
jgi:sugar (pentulose or hexulose) kinase